MLEKDTNLSRRYLANPHQKQSFLERLKINNSIDLRDNRVIVDLGNGYSEIKPIDSNKRFTN
ncbi:hypothetical protein CN269_04340 [Bacillus thuringiensis]|uniref:hypothetical protein n=1 Tax=Bacillus thuringiensis TaxID=1428 RepID=UPI000BF64360|nr:hypothetical protein [Bacillus thuringiensis]PFD32543.1 hypothetical protein CN269_04340 [Bacillus thuringiensis]